MAREFKYIIFNENTKRKVTYVENEKVIKKTENCYDKKKNVAKKSKKCCFVSIGVIVLLIGVIVYFCANNEKVLSIFNKYFENTYNIFSFVILVFVLNCFIRLASSCMKSIENDMKKGKWEAWNIYCKGFNIGNQNMDDYWFPFIIGAVEISIYPVLIATQRWGFIGWWLGLKTVGKWSRWGECRTTYNRFLIGNVLVIIAAYILKVLFVVAR